MSNTHKKKTGKKDSPVIENRRAYYDYAILEEYEVGIVLQGSEVKSLRAGKANLIDGYADVRPDGKHSHAIILINSYIAEYSNASQQNHHPNRPRKLLLHKLEIKRLLGKVKTKGLTLIPLKIYFNDKGLAKCTLALAKGKAQHDKRQSIKDREWNRDKARVLKGGE